MKIRFLAGLALLALALASCNNPVTTVTGIYTLVTSATVSQGQAAALHSSIGAVEHTTDTYLETCIKPENNGQPGCDKPTVGKVAKALAAVRAADNDLFNALVVAQKAGSTVQVVSTAYNAAVDAFNALSAAKPATA